ncbi:MAG: hypothetical protein HYZ53_30275 [Planctomycetes bacterium]|nr:hypothetical protein [Planctomycetota bacterium]
MKTRSAEAETPSGSEPGDWASPTREDGLPELRLSWESAEHFIRVARALEFRVVAVDARDKPAGLLRLGPGELRVEPLPPGAFVGYSTRGRTLGREAVPATARLLPSGEQAAGWWVLIPAQLDREFAAIQRRALDASGEEAKARDTREMVGRFKPDGSTFRLVLASPKPTASATGAAAGSRESQSAE